MIFPFKPPYIGCPCHVWVPDGRYSFALPVGTMHRKFTKRGSSKVCAFRLESYTETRLSWFRPFDLRHTALYHTRWCPPVVSWSMLPSKPQALYHDISTINLGWPSHKKPLLSYLGGSSSPYFWGDQIGLWSGSVDFALRIAGTSWSWCPRVMAGKKRWNVCHFPFIFLAKNGMVFPTLMVIWWLIDGLLWFIVD